MNMENSCRKAVGVDFGGTGVKMAVVDDQGTILSRGGFATADASSQKDWLHAVEQELHKITAAAGLTLNDLDGVGVGVPGFVDFARGYVHNLANVPGWTGVYLKEMLRQQLRLPAVIDNDVNAMALGESKFGAGRNYDHVVFVTLGTGVGGGILIHGKIYRGAYSTAGEIGHMSIDMNGIKSPEGSGGLEQYVGNRRIVERAVRLIGEGRPTGILELAGGRTDNITPKIIAEAAHAGDPLALEIFDFVADCLAAAFASITYLIQPEVFILGGGVAQSGRVLFDPLMRHLTGRLSPFIAEHVSVIPAELGSDAGVIGAAGLLWTPEA